MLCLWYAAGVEGSDESVRLCLLYIECDSLALTIFYYFQMFDWIFHNRDAFMASYVDIGHSFATSKKLQDDHNHFTLSSNVKMICSFL